MALTSIDLVESLKGRILFRPPAWLQLACAGMLALFGLGCASTSDSHKPNIIFLLADDLGYGDVGSFGQQKIRTPNLDRLAAEGVRLTHHYSGNAVCAPSRCVLMTGMHSGHAWIRANKEVQPEGQEPISAGTVTLAELLKEQGYATGAVGKWGLGPPGSEGDPLRQGFDRFFGYNCQRHAHNHYPTYLWDNDRRVVLENPEFSAHQALPAEADPNDPAAYERYRGAQYAPDLFSEAARAFIREHRDEPFFLYYATTIPHLALQVPEDSLREYVGLWPDPPYTGDRRYLPHFTPRAAYAAMVTRMDREIGRIMDLVRELGLEEETIFVFSSDNGPAPQDLGGTDSRFFRSAGPFRGLKGSLYEGGIRVPTIVRWKGKIQPGRTSDYVSGFEDWLPTLLDLIGAEGFIPKGVDGISLAPTLLDVDQEPRRFLYREYPREGGWQAVRMGNWKGIRRHLLDEPPDLGIELYNLKDDVAESQDVSSEYPEIVAEIERIMREEHVPSAVFPLAILDGQ